MSRTVGGLLLTRSLSYGWQSILSRAAFAPEWWTWAFSGLVWIGLIGAAVSSADHGSMHGMHGNADDLKSLVVSFTIATGGWLAMVAAMMFPLQTEPVRFVAFANPKRRRHKAIALFLGGYTTLWAAAGLAFLSVRYALTAVFPDATPGLQAMIGTVGFAVAAALVWAPGRRVAMAACGTTMPLRIMGWRADADAFHFGLKIGRICLRTCWAPMAALTLARHDLAFMVMVTLWLVYERYRLPHKSKATGYAWGAIALVFFCMGAYHYSAIGIKSLERMSYQIKMGLRPASSRNVGVQMASSGLFELVGAVNQPLVLHSRPLSFSIEFLAPSRRRPRLTKLVPSSPPERLEISLHFENITGTDVPPIYDVYLNVPKEQSKPSTRYAGSLPFYGIETSSTPSRHHDGHGQHFALDISQLIFRLRSLPDWSEERLHITLEPTRPMPPEASAVIGRVSLYVGKEE